MINICSFTQNLKLWLEEIVTKQTRTFNMTNAEIQLNHAIFMCEVTFKDSLKRVKPPNPSKVKASYNYHHNKRNRRQGHLKQPGGASCNQRR